MQEFIRNGKFDSYSVSVKHFQDNENDIKYKILKTVYELTNVFIDKVYVSSSSEDLSADASAFKVWVKLFNVNFISKKLGKGNHELLPYFYNLSDSGHIRFVRNNKKKSLSIGLGSPLIYYHFASNGKDLISLDEAAALKSPVGQPNEDLAENVTLRLLAEKAQKFFKTTNQNFLIVDTAIEKIVLKHDYKNCLKDEINANRDEDLIINRLFEECFDSHRDAFGNLESMVSHLKKTHPIRIGCSCIKVEDADKIVS